MSDKGAFEPGFYAWYGRETPVDRINKQIAGIVERCSQTGQDVPQEQVDSLKRQAYELGGR